MAILLSDCPGMFNTSLDEIKILMEHEKDFFQRWTAKTNTNDLELHPKAVDKLEQLYKDKDNLAIKYSEIANAMELPVFRIGFIINSHRNELEGSIISDYGILMDDYAIKYKSLPKLIELLNDDKKKYTDVNTDNDAIKYTNYQAIIELLHNDKKEHTDMNNTDTTTATIVDTPTDIESDNNDTPTISTEPTAESETATTVTVEPKKTTKRKTSGRRKKSKYLASKNDFLEMFSTESIDDMKTLRMFLLSLPEYNVEDIAIMSDNEIKDMFYEKYIAITINNKTLITHKSKLETLWAQNAINDDLFIITHDEDPS